MMQKNLKSDIEYTCIWMESACNRSDVYITYFVDNCIQKKSFGEVYRRINDWNFSFKLTNERSCKT